MIRTGFGGLLCIGVRAAGFAPACLMKVLSMTMASPVRHAKVLGCRGLGGGGGVRVLGVSAFRGLLGFW